MIRIDEIYNNIFLPIIQTKPKQSMHYFDPFGSTDISALCVAPRIVHRDKTFLFWDQEPFFPDVHNDTIEFFYSSFIRPNGSKTEFKDIRASHPISDAVFVTSEKNSKNVDMLLEEYNFKSAYYFFHAWAALDWFRGYNRTLLIGDFKNRNITTTFICPNRIVSGKRKHRIELFEKMVDDELLHNKISFPKRCAYNNSPIDIPNVKLPLLFEGEYAENIPNESYKISLWEHAKESLLYVVTETVFVEETLHLTEKIFKPIVMSMPFVLVGARYNLEYLRSYGFKTFGEFWNEDYDNEDNQTRINSVSKLLKELDDLSSNDKKQIQKYITPIVEHNFKWFYSKEFEELLWRELSAMTNKW